MMIITKNSQDYFQMLWIPGPLRTKFYIDLVFDLSIFLLQNYSFSSFLAGIVRARIESDIYANFDTACPDAFSLTHSDLSFTFKLLLFFRALLRIVAQWLIISVLFMQDLLLTNYLDRYMHQILCQIHQSS